MTDLAYEAARKLGLEVECPFSKPPAAPLRPYLSEVKPSSVDLDQAADRLRDQAAGSYAGAVQTTATGDIREELLKINNELYAAGLITSTGGNISVRIQEKPGELWISPGAIFKGDLRTDMMVRIDLDGKPLDADGYPASSERFVHTEVLKQRPELNAVIHTHPSMAMIMALTGRPFLPISIESAFIGEIARVDFIKPGSIELGKAVAEAMGNSFAVLMQNHGLVVAGRTLRSAADMTLVIEQTAKKVLGCYALGEEPPVLPPDAVEEYRKLGEMRA